MKHPSILYIDQTTKNLQQNEKVFASYLNALQTHPCGPLNDTLRHRIFWLTKHQIPYCKRSSCNHCHKNIVKQKKLCLTQKDCYKNVFRTALSLPLYGLDKTNRNEANSSFWRWFGKTFGAYANYRSEEKQGGLRNRHYVVFTIRPVDNQKVAERWLYEINKRISISKKSFEGECEPVYEYDGWCDYLLKNYDSLPVNYLAPSWSCRTPYRKSNNWSKFWEMVEKECSETSGKIGQCINETLLRNVGPVDSPEKTKKHFFWHWWPKWQKYFELTAPTSRLYWCRPFNLIRSCNDFRRKKRRIGLIVRSNCQGLGIQRPTNRKVEAILSGNGGYPLYRYIWCLATPRKELRIRPL